MSENQKKILANQIKEDLQKDLEEARKEEKSERGFGGRSWIIGLGESCSEYRGNERRLSYYRSPKDDSYKKYEKRRRYGRSEIGVFPEELEPNDWKGIESLIQQIKSLEEKKEEKETQKNREEQANMDQKLKDNPKTFFYEGLWEWENGSDDIRHVFRGMENGQKFYLVFPKNHPITVHFPKQNDYRQEKKFYLIEGVENVPLQSKKVRLEPHKEVKLTDKITITEYNDAEDKTNHNSRHSEQPKGDYGKLFLVGAVVFTALILISALIINKRRTEKIAKKRIKYE